MARRTARVATRRASRRTLGSASMRRRRAATSADAAATERDEAGHRLPLGDLGGSVERPAGAEAAEVGQVVEQAPDGVVRPSVALVDGHPPEPLHQLVDPQRLLHLHERPHHAGGGATRDPGHLGHVGRHLQLPDARPPHRRVRLEPVVDQGLGQSGPPPVAEGGAHLGQGRLQGHRRGTVAGHAGGDIHTVAPPEVVPGQRLQHRAHRRHLVVHQPPTQAVGAVELPPPVVGPYHVPPDPPGGGHLRLIPAGVGGQAGGERHAHPVDHLVGHQRRHQLPAQPVPVEQPVEPAIQSIRQRGREVRHQRRRAAPAGRAPPTPAGPRSAPASPPPAARPARDG